MYVFLFVEYYELYVLIIHWSDGFKQDSKCVVSNNNTNPEYNKKLKITFL